MDTKEDINKKVVSQEEMVLLVNAICRRSSLIADTLGLSLTKDELERIYTMIGIRFFVEKVTDDYMPTVGDLLEFAYVRGKYG